MSTLAAIRAATGPEHDRLERDLDVLARLDNGDSRRALMLGFFGVYAAAEAALAPHLGAVSGLDFERRRKLSSLIADLGALGIPAATLAQRLLPAAPSIAGTPEALGFAYVLEGATLGGRIIRRRAAQAGQSTTGLGFFDVYGDSTGPQWQSFCRVLDRECDGQSDAAVRGARAGYAFVGAGLLGIG